MDLAATSHYFSLLHCFQPESVESTGIQEFHQNLSESRNSGGMDRIPAAFLSIPCTFNRNSTLQRTDKSYTKKITI